MPQWTVISKQQHAKARYYPRDGYHHARDQLVTPILLAELPKLVQHFVLGLMPQGEGFVAVALLGVEQHQNLYVHPDGRWLGGYIPASLRGYPFNLLPNEQGQRILCIDAEQLIMSDTDVGLPLFDDNGQPTEAVARQLDFHQHCVDNLERTQQAVNALQQAGVLVPWVLEISRGEGAAPKRIDGLYRIDEETLNNLEAEAYATLQGAPMALAHAQLFGVNQTHQLVERARLHENSLVEYGAPPENLDSLFDGDEDDLTFDFDS